MTIECTIDELKELMDLLQKKEPVAELKGKGNKVTIVHLPHCKAE